MTSPLDAVAVLAAQSFASRALVSAALLSLAVHAPVALHAQAAPDTARKFQGSASLGFAQVSGNASARTINVADKIKYAFRGWGVAQDLVFFYGEAEGEVNANFWSGGVRGERDLTRRLAAFVATRFDRNELQGITSRFEEGAGLAYKMLELPRDKFTLSAGASMFQQRLAEGTTSEFKRNFPAARVGADYKHLFSELAFFQQTAEYLPNLSDTEVWFVNTESALVAPLRTNLGLKVGYVVRFNAAPPVKDGVRLEKTDTFLSSGVTYSF
jgi:putative salt-induced outer membrane protein